MKLLKNPKSYDQKSCGFKPFEIPADFGVASLVCLLKIKLLETLGIPAVKLFGIS